MPFDDDLTAGLAALASRARPGLVSPDTLLRLEEIRRHRRIAAGTGTVMAVTATGALLTTTPFGQGTSRAELQPGSSASPTGSAAAATVPPCPSSVAEPSPSTMPASAMPVASPVAGAPKPSAAPNSPPPVPEAFMTSRLAQAIQGAAPDGTAPVCTLPDNVLYRAGDSAQPNVDVAAGSWTDPYPELGPDSQTVKHYSNGDERRTQTTTKYVMVELWAGTDFLVWTVEPPSALTAAGAPELESWADRVHTALA